MLNNNIRLSGFKPHGYKSPSIALCLKYDLSCIFTRYKLLKKLLDGLQRMIRKPAGKNSHISPSPYGNLLQANKIIGDI